MEAFFVCAEGGGLDSDSSLYIDYQLVIQIYSLVTA